MTLSEEINKIHEEILVNQTKVGAAHKIIELFKLYDLYSVTYIDELNVEYGSEVWAKHRFDAFEQVKGTSHKLIMISKL